MIELRYVRRCLEALYTISLPHYTGMSSIVPANRRVPSLLPPVTETPPLIPPPVVKTSLVEPDEDPSPVDIDTVGRDSTNAVFACPCVYFARSFRRVSSIYLVCVENMVLSQDGRVRSENVTNLFHSAEVWSFP